MRSYAEYTEGENSEENQGSTICCLIDTNVVLAYDSSLHPDNLDTYRPLETNVDYVFHGETRTIYHGAEFHIREAEKTMNLGEVVAVFLEIIAVLLAIPGLGTKVVAAVIALIAAILATVNKPVDYFLHDILQTELNDFWAYAWGGRSLVVHTLGLDELRSVEGLGMALFVLGSTTNTNHAFNAIFTLRGWRWKWYSG